MKKVIKPMVWLVGLLASAFALMVLISAIIYSPQYIYRTIVNGESKITDYAFFPEKGISKSDAPYHYEVALDDSLANMNISTEGGTKTAALSELLENNETTSIIVIRNDRVIYEKYFNGYGKDSIETSFSSVKSLVSLLIGMAIEDGYIHSETQSISDFIPEFKGTELETITIENLLMMRSKIRYEEGFAWFTDDAKTYYMPDLRDLALHHMRIDKSYTGQFHYNNYHPLLLGIILERSTGMRVSEYFQKKIWGPVGAEYDASWSIDSEKTGFEKMESGLNFISIDYAKIGSMLLHRGQWNGLTVMGEDWIERSTIAPAPLEQSDIDSDFLKSVKVGYRYMWYSTENDKGGYDFFASGKYGQYLYISPENHTVIVRTGFGTGGISWWPDVLKQIAAGAAAE